MEDDLSAPPLPDEDPISSLLGTRVSQMTDEQLEEHTKRIRAAREQPQILRSLLAGKVKKTPVSKKIDLSLLGL